MGLQSEDGRGMAHGVVERQRGSLALLYLHGNRLRTSRYRLQQASRSFQVDFTMTNACGVFEG